MPRHISQKCIEALTESFTRQTMTLKYGYRWNECVITKEDKEMMRDYRYLRLKFKETIKKIAEK